MTREITASFSLHPARSSVGSSTFSGGEKTGFFVPKNMTKTYAEKLRDPRWQKKRLQVMERDDFQCQLCLSKDHTLNVHHAFYDKGKDPWEYEDHHLVTLCERCHKSTEINRRGTLAAMSLHPEWWGVLYRLSTLGRRGAGDRLWNIAMSLSDCVNDINEGERLGQIDVERFQQHVESLRQITSRLSEEIETYTVKRPSLDEMIDQAQESSEL